tara:strand:- start:537 stop:1301 length:765 start_codon:yes stop_codon:yes gene_type:complete
MNTLKLFGSPIGTNFKKRKKTVSISVDSLEHDSTADIRVFIQVEPPSVKNLLDSIVQNQDQFDLILAWHPQVLENCSNSKKFIFGTCWIDLQTFENNKQNQISFLTSNKNWTEGHKLRQSIYEYLNTEEDINGFSIKTIRTPPRIDCKSEVFKNAKFSIIVENESLPNWITEKLIDCFSTKTIPIYWGCSNIDKYFDSTGIIQFGSIDELSNILNELTPQQYEDLLPVIEKNYKSSLQYHDLLGRIDKEIDLIL